MRGAIYFDFEKDSMKNFEAQCQVAIQNVGRGTRKATEEACIEIMNESKRQVPKMTRTLLLSAFYEVSRRTDTSAASWVYEAILGYGGNGDPVNPITGRPASEYMVAVHEDLDAIHTTGKAKFLEDPVRQYASKNFARTVFKNVKESLASLSD
jgi:hypothetical protein